MGNNVSLWIWDSRDYFYEGKCFGEVLLSEFNKHKDWFKSASKVLLEKPYDTEGVLYTQQGMLSESFIEHVTIPFDLAQKVAFGDVITSGCLFSETEIGTDIISLISLIDIVFILVNKRWTGCGSLKLEFVACQDDFEYGILNAIRTGTFNCFND